MQTRNIFDTILLVWFFQYKKSDTLFKPKQFKGKPEELKMRKQIVLKKSCVEFFKVMLLDHYFILTTSTKILTTVILSEDFLCIRNK